MPVLNSSEYDQAYFDGAVGSLKHNAGYSYYRRWFRKKGRTSLGEYWKDRADNLLKRNIRTNRKVLEIGCAKGFLVEDLREMGVNVIGLDVSSYAIGEANPAIAPFLIVGDARTALTPFRNNEFDFVFSLQTLECFSETEMPSLIEELNRISRNQYHLITTGLNPAFYNIQPQSWWENLNWSTQTTLEFKVK